MKKNFRKKIERKKIKNCFLFFIILIIIFMCVFLLNKFNQIVTPKIIEISKLKAEQVIYNLISNKLNYLLINDTGSLENMIKIHKNSEGEVITVDFELDNAYSLLKNINNQIEKSFKLNENGILFEIPSGQYTNSSFFGNMGPKIPVKINFEGAIITNLKTKVSDYGLNNILVELYVNVIFVEEIISPINRTRLDIDYNILLSSKLINGRIPSFYGGVIEKESKLFDVSKN